MTQNSGSTRFTAESFMQVSISANTSRILHKGNIVHVKSALLTPSFTWQVLPISFTQERLSNSIIKNGTKSVFAQKFEFSYHFNCLLLTPCLWANFKVQYYIHYVYSVLIAASLRRWQIVECKIKYESRFLYNQRFLFNIHFIYN